MKNKNTRRIIAGVFAAALVLQSTAMTTISAFADESGTDTAATDTTTPSTPDADTAPDAADTTQPAPEQTAPAESDQSTPDDAEPQSDALTITGGTVVPSEIQQGDFLIVKGTVTSAASDITSVVVGIYDVNGTKLCGGTADEPASKTYDLNRLDRFVSFDKLAAGTYIYRVTASNASGSNVILSEQTFTVANHDVAADTLTVTGGTSVPAELKSGSIVNVKGTLVSASSNITAVSVGVYDASGNKVSGGSAEPNTKTFDLSTLDDAVSFDTLAVGTYAYKVIATNSGNANYTVISQEFSVVADSVTADTLTITGGLNVPDTLTQGKALNVTGVVTSASSDIVTLTVGVYDAEGKFITGSTIAPKVKSYDLRRLDNDVKFSQLSAGKYTYAVIASNAANTNYALVNKQFTVEGQSAQTDTLTITGAATIPDNLAQGKSLSISGTVTSASSNITALTAGVYDANGKFVTGRTIAPNAKSYSLKNLDAYVAFNKLAAGSYTYAVIASNAGNNNYALVNKQFVVGNANTPSATDDKLTITGGMTVPETLAVGKALNVTGVVTSASSNMTALTVGVYDMDGKFVTGRTIAPNAKSYDLKRLDAYVAFNKLAAGKYVYAVIATNAANANYALVNKQFIVGNGSTPSTPSAEDDKLTITGGTNVPDTLAVGKALNVVGTVTSASSNITALTVGVYDADGKFVTGRTINPNSKTYNLRLLDAYVAFSKLAEGSYTYAVIATNSGNTNYALVNKKFTVGNGTPSTTDDKLTITGGTNVPDTLAVGKALNVTGTVTSASSNITALTVGVYDANGKFVTGRTIAPNAKSYDLKNLDAYVAFNKLTEGSYTYAVIASNAANTNYALVSKKFTVGNGTPSTTDDKLTITGGTNVPDTLAVGKALNVTGTVTSASSNITALTVGVYDANGNFVTGRTIAPNAKSYDLKNLDAYVAFNKLAEGSYTYAVIASNAANTNYALVSKKFTVGNGTPSTTDDKLTITGGTNVPDTLAVGKALNVTGTVTSASSNITALTVGVYDANGKFVTGRTIAPNAKSYDLKNLDAYVAFNKLTEGSYTYAVIASNAANTNYALVSKKFTVGNGTPSTTDDKLTITGGMTVPDTLAVGKALNVTGTVTSASSNITALTVGVYDANGKFVTGRTIAPNAKSYDLKNLDAYVAFSNLAEGSYTYAVIASNAANTNYALVSKKFTVGNGTPSTTDDKLTITGGTNVPDTLAVGKALNVTGTVTSASSNITALTVGVYDVDGKFVTGRTIAPNVKSYDLKNLDAYVAFNRLAAGSYTYAVIASNAANTNYALVSKKFTVGGNAPSTSGDALTITGGTVVPDNMALGKALSINGTVTSASSNITSLTAGVYDASGKFVTGRTIAPNAKSYNLKNLDAYIAFNTLPAGKYVYAVIASNAANTNYALVNKTFTVGGQTTPSTGDALTISGGTAVPDTLAQGKALSIRGTVTSASSNITALTAGVYDASGKFVTGRTIAPNAKSYDLKNLDAYIAFNTLPAGKYVYAVIASNAANTNYALVTKTFTVGTGGSTTPSTGDTLTISGGTVVPSTLTKGRGVSVRGTVTSASSNITSVTVGVYNASGALVTGSTANPNAKSYNVNALDSAVRFDQLAAGTYSYRVVVSNGANSNYAVVNQSFTVR